MANRYLKITLLDQDPIYVRENDDRQDPQSPDFVSDGVAIWINEED